MREIGIVLSDRGIERPTKADIQSACKYINGLYTVKRFSQKNAEKWIQIRWRYNGDRPEPMSFELRDKLRSEFRDLECRWLDVKHLLTGSNKSTTRDQWPNYHETLYKMLKYKHLGDLETYHPWITRLSKKKRRDLKPFFKRLFELVGWLPALKESQSSCSSVPGLVGLPQRASIISSSVSERPDRISLPFRMNPGCPWTYPTSRKYPPVGSR